MTVKAFELQKFSRSYMQNLKTVCYHTDCP